MKIIFINVLLFFSKMKQNSAADHDILRRGEVSRLAAEHRNEWSHGWVGNAAGIPFSLVSSYNGYPSVDRTRALRALV